MNNKHFPLPGFQERLRDAWLATGLTQKDVGNMIGFNRKAISNWLNGDTLPNATALGRMCKVFHVSADYLLFGNEKKKE